MSLPLENSGNLLVFIAGFGFGYFLEVSDCIQGHVCRHRGGGDRTLAV